MKSLGALCVSLLLVAVTAIHAAAVPVPVTQLSANGWFSDDTRADGSGVHPSATNLISPTLTDAPEGTSGAASAAFDADILDQIIFGAPPVAPPAAEHQSAVRLFIDAIGGAGGKSQISHRKDDATGFGSGDLLFQPGFFANYSWFGDGTTTVSAGFKLGIRTSEFGAAGTSGRTGENVWDKVLIYEPGDGNGNTSDGATWYQEAITSTQGKWWFFDRTTFESSQAFNMTLNDMLTSTQSIGSRTIADVAALINDPNAVITSIQFGIGSNNPGGSVYVNQFSASFYDAGNTITFGGLPVTNVTQGISYPTIQSAIDAANPADEIQVAAGIYAEQVTIDKDISLIGAGIGNTIIRSPDVLVSTFAYSSRTFYPVVSVVGGTSSLIQGLTVDGAGKGSGNDTFVGVGFYDAGVTLDQCRVTGVRESPLNGNQHGLGVYGVYQDAGTHTVVVSNSQVDDFQKNGITMNAYGGTVLDAQVLDNVVTGAGVLTADNGDPAQNGIQTQGVNTTATITGNTVSGINYDNTTAPTAWVASSVLTYYGTVVMENNVIGPAQTGAYLVEGNATVRNNDITVEKVGLESYGIVVADPPRAVPQPFEAEPIGTGLQRRAGLFTVSIEDNNVQAIGTDITATYGLIVFMGYVDYALDGPETMDLSITGNAVNGFDEAVDLLECTSGCTGSTFNSITINQNDFSGNNVGIFSDATSAPVDASCNWWGDLSGPLVTLSNPDGAGSAVVGDVAFTPWLDAFGGTCDQYGPNNVAVLDPGVSIAGCESCVPVTVEFVRADTTPLRALSVDFQLSPELALCGPQVTAITDAGSGGVFEGYVPGTDFQALLTPNGGGSYTYDLAAFGTNCGPTTGGPLFTIHVTDSNGFAADATGSIEITGTLVRDCAGLPLSGVPGPGTTIDVDATPPAPITDFVAAQKRSGNDTDGDVIIDLSWTAPADADYDGIAIFRKGFGDYPEYDDGTGVAPTLPATIADANNEGWTPVATVAPGTTSFPDEPGTRDFFTYVAFTTDQCYETASALSNGALSYFLGDVASGGDNAVFTQDFSALGAAYGTIEGDVNYNAFVDVGPTTDFSVESRPTTDNAIQFEDFVVFAINFNSVSRLAPIPAAAANGVELFVPERNGETLNVEIRATGDGTLQALSVPVQWNEDVLEYDGWFEGDLMGAQPGQALTLSAEAGVIDAAVFGARQGIAGEGRLATLRFRVKGEGDPGLEFGEIDGRNAENESVVVDGSVLRGVAGDAPSVLRTELRPNVPNPFNPRTTVNFAVGREGPVSVRIYDVAGRLVRTLVDEAMTAGVKAVDWDGKDDAGRSVSSGTYLLRLSTSDVEQSRRMLLVK